MQPHRYKYTSLVNQTRTIQTQNRYCDPPDFRKANDYGKVLIPCEVFMPTLLPWMK